MTERPASSAPADQPRLPNENDRLRRALYRTVEKLGGDPDILAAVGSLWDTLGLHEATDLIEDWLVNGTAFASVTTDPVEIDAVLSKLPSAPAAEPAYSLLADMMGCAERAARKMETDMNEATSAPRWFTKGEIINEERCSIHGALPLPSTFCAACEEEAAKNPPEDPWAKLRASCQEVLDLLNSEDPYVAHEGALERLEAALSPHMRRAA